MLKLGPVLQLQLFEHLGFLVGYGFAAGAAMILLSHHNVERRP